MAGCRATATWLHDSVIRVNPRLSVLKARGPEYTEAVHHYSPASYTSILTVIMFTWSQCSQAAEQAWAGCKCLSCQWPSRKARAAHVKDELQQAAPPHCTAKCHRKLVAHILPLSTHATTSSQPLQTAWARRWSGWPLSASAWSVHCCGVRVACCIDRPNMWPQHGHVHCCGVRVTCSIDRPNLCLSMECALLWPLGLRHPGRPLHDTSVRSPHIEQKCRSRAIRLCIATIHPDESAST